MASNVTVSVDQFASTIDQIMKEYGDKATLGMQIAGQKTTKETAKMVNSSAASMIHGRRGTYEKSWKSKTSVSRLFFEGVVYSSQPGLPHLLEHGHAITYLGGNKSKGPGSARAIPHIAVVDAQVPELFEQNIRREIENI